MSPTRTGVLNHSVLSRVKAVIGPEQKRRSKYDRGARSCTPPCAWAWWRTRSASPRRPPRSSTWTTTSSPRRATRAATTQTTHPSSCSSGGPRCHCSSAPNSCCVRHTRVGRVYNHLHIFLDTCRVCDLCRQHRHHGAGAVPGRSPGDRHGHRHPRPEVAGGASTQKNISHREKNI